MAKIVDAELVRDPARWVQLVPPASSFSLHAAFAAFDALVADADAETARLQAAGERVPGELLDAMDAFLALDDWLSNQAAVALPEATAARFRGEMVRRGLAAYAAMGRAGVVRGSVGDIPESRRMGADESLLGAALLIGAAWLVDRWLGRRGR